MRDPFLTFWFRGLEKALSQLDTHGIDTLMTHCGQACSDSYPKQVYMEEYRAADTLDGFLAGLTRRFDGAAFRRAGADAVEIVYARCGCELVQTGYLSDPKLCLCSLKSLQYNWDAVLGPGRAVCSMEQSILGGGDCCRFFVKIKPETE